MFTVTSLQKAVLNTTLEFANMSDIRTPDQIENLFYGLPLPKKEWKILKERGEDGARIYRENDQRKLRCWLDDISSRGSLHKADVELLSSVIERTVITHARLRFPPSTHDLSVEYQIEFGGVEACYSYAVGLILSSSLGLTDRLRRCRKRDCGKYFIDWGGRGRPQLYCTPAHGAADKMRRSRDEQKQKRARDEDRKTMQSLELSKQKLRKQKLRRLSP